MNVGVLSSFHGSFMYVGVSKQRRLFRMDWEGEMTENRCPGVAQ